MMEKISSCFSSSSLRAVFHERHDRPAVVRGSEAADTQAVFQIGHVLLMNIGLGVVFFLPVLHPLE